MEKRYIEEMYQKIYNMHKFFIIVYANNNKEFKKEFKKSKNSILVSFEDVKTYQQNISVFNEEISKELLSIELNVKLDKALKKLQKNDTHSFIYYYIDSLENIESVYLNLKTIVNNEDIHFKFLSLKEINDSENDILKALNIEIL